MPEFKHRATYHKRARDVMLVRSQKAAIVTAMRRVSVDGFALEAK